MRLFQCIDSAPFYSNASPSWSTGAKVKDRRLLRLIDLRYTIRLPLQGALIQIGQMKAKSLVSLANYGTASATARNGRKSS